VVGGGCERGKERWVSFKKKIGLRCLKGSPCKPYKEMLPTRSRQSCSKFISIKSMGSTRWAARRTTSEQRHLSLNTQNLGISVEGEKRNALHKDSRTCLRNGKMGTGTTVRTEPSSAGPHYKKELKDALNEIGGETEHKRSKEDSRKK